MYLVPLTTHLPRSRFSAKDEHPPVHAISTDRSIVVRVFTCNKDVRFSIPTLRRQPKTFNVKRPGITDLLDLEMEVPSHDRRR